MKIKEIIAAAAAAVSVLAGFPQLTAGSADEPHFTVTASSDKDGVLNIDDTEWYKVDSFEDGGEYLIGVTGSDGSISLLTAEDDEACEYIWQFYDQVMVTSTSNKYTSLYTSSFRLSCHENVLYPRYSWWLDTDQFWDYSGGLLTYTEGDTEHYLKYDEGSDTPFSCTDDISEAAEVSIYSCSELLSRCISEHPHAESYVIEGSGYSAPVFSVKLSSPDIIADDIRWFADGEEQACGSLSFTADILREKPVGVHRVNCIVTGHDSSGIHYRERSEDALFIIAKGIVPDSFITFSDVHEEYSLIGKAIEQTLAHTGGYAPALVVCTGDLVNGPTKSRDSLLKRYYPRIVSELGGLDAVFVSGNHDSGEAATVMSVKAGLGAPSDNTAGGGPVFCGNSADAKKNGKSSRFAKDITVYGLNFEASVYGTKGNYTYSYEKAIKDISAFLEKTAENYRGELIVISAHSGLHVLGVQPETVDDGRYGGTWLGENQYNVDLSYDLAKLINRYAEKYDMDIMYLFGHDHSRNERELLLTDGNELLSTISYPDRSFGTQELHFTYGHSGYLSTAIGVARANFSFVARNGDSFSFDLINALSGDFSHKDITARNPLPKSEEAPAITTAAAVTSAVSSARAADSPKTGDSGAMILPLAMAVPLLLSRKKKNK